MEIALVGMSNDECQTQLQSMCRMCATKTDKAVPIFSQEGIQHELAIKLQTHLPVKISEEDSLPQQLCYDCTSLLIQWDAALVGALAADRKLRAIQWKQQQAALAKKREAESCVEQRQETSCYVAKESLCCSICNRSGMDFRELILHLKNHEPEVPHGGEKEFTDASNSANSSVKINVTVDDNMHQTSTDSANPSITSPESQKQTRGKKGKGIPGSPVQRTNSETVENGSDSVKNRLRKRKPKPNPSDIHKDAGPEIGSGDPQVTSSTGTPPFRPSDIPANQDSSPANTLLQTLNSCSYMKKNEVGKIPSMSGEPSQRNGQSPQDGVPKPKVRIISAENINLSLEQRAKANMNAKPTGTDPIRINPPKGVSSVSVLSSSEKTSDTSVVNKNKIIISSDIVKQLGNTRGRPGPKLLRLKDGRIVRLLDTAPTVSSLSNSYQRIYRPIQPCPGGDLPISKTQPRSVLLKSPVPPLPKISNVITVSDKSFAQEPSITAPSKDDRMETASSPVLETNGSTVAIKMEPLENLASSPQHTIERRMVNVSFHPQPGPKNSVPRFTCFQCGKRNLLHDALHAHAQTHAPDKAVLNAVSVPRSFSSVVASSIIRVVSSELNNQISTATPSNIPKTVEVSKQNIVNS